MCVGGLVPNIAYVNGSFMNGKCQLIDRYLSLYCMMHTRIGICFNTFICFY